ncbi:unnamed protein product [Penicillium salamii]|uniref:Uncharacterized protein n=1 Tax=Penicillium salamii TaxID=1612424 RepID=A0A9W4NNP1_9EURO|nr:unnamed protein product [Penicillium salamii]
MTIRSSSAEGSGDPRPLYDNDDETASVASSVSDFEPYYEDPPVVLLPDPWPVEHLTPRLARPFPETVLMVSVHNGDAAFDEANYPLAIQNYTEALVEEPRAPRHYISRSVAYARLKPENGGPNYQAALEDAEVALSIAADRGNREYLLSANFRRAVSLYQLGRLGDAAFLFTELARSIKHEQVSVSVTAENSYRSQIPSWATKLEGMKAKQTVGDPRWDVTITFLNKDAFIPSLDLLKAQLEAAKTGVPPPTFEPEAKSGNPSRPDDYVPKSLEHLMPNTIRHDWFQTKEVITVTFYAKPFSFNDVEVVVKLLKDEASVALPIPGRDHYNMIMPLFAEINPDRSSYILKAHKLEVKLRKVIPILWKELLGDPKPGETRDVQARHFEFKNNHIVDCPKDWNEVLTSKRAKEKAKEKNNEKSKANVTADDSDSDHGDDVDAFFKKLYASADPETRRAMVKSFTESQGTSLSTNWKDVSKEKVEPRQ